MTLLRVILLQMVTPTPTNIRTQNSESLNKIIVLVISGISHGVDLAKSSTLQYLYYLAQMGIAVSPLSINALILDFDNMPFLKFFKRGLCITLVCLLLLMLRTRSRVFE
jgi:adenosine deaminase